MPIARRIRGRIGNPRSRGSGSDARREAAAAMASAEYKLTRLINKIEGATPAALEYALEPMFDKSWLYTPVDTGALKLSGYLEAEQTPRGATAVIGYAADGNPGYAVFVHEMIGFKHEPPTRSKFLEAAMYEHLDEVLPRVRDFLAGVVDGES